MLGCLTDLHACAASNRGHNYLRITRILKSLGLLGLEHLKLPWLQFLVQEIFVHGQLPRAADSCRHYWVSEHPHCMPSQARMAPAGRAGRSVRGG